MISAFASCALVMPRSAFALRIEGYNHFKCYGISNAVPITNHVALADKFDKILKTTEKSDLLTAFQFCNPVQKTVTVKGKTTVSPIVRGKEDEHLTLYNFEPSGDTKTIIGNVTIGNQFGSKQLFQIDGSSPILAVPTQKVSVGNHGFPETLDHFKCRSVTGRNINLKADLIDQFIVETVTVTSPNLLCNPVSKSHTLDVREQEIYTPDSPDVYLVCYLVEGVNPNFSISNLGIKNQFGNEQTFYVSDVDQLCVPSQLVDYSVQIAN
jgi:hypothetical protein